MAIGRISGPMLFSNLERQGVDLAFQSNLLYLDVNTLRVGIINSSPQYALDSSGNVKLANLVIEGNTISSNTGVVNLGSISNITIAGGLTNSVIFTDGLGNLSFGQISDLDIQWGNILLKDNTISIVEPDGNLNLAANGTGKVTTSFDFYAGNVFAYNLDANIASNAGSFVELTVTNFSSGNVLITGGNITNLTDIQTTTGNAATWYSAELNSSSANITTGVVDNFSTGNAQITGGNVTAEFTGNITGTTGSFSANVTADWFVGNIEAAKANFSDAAYFNSTVDIGANLTTLSNLIASGNVITQKITSPVGDLHFSAATNDPNNIIRFDSVSAFDIPTGNTAQRPPTPDYGFVRYNTDLGSIEWWGGSTWVPATNPITAQIINPDGVAQTYTLDQASTATGILVSINGTVQRAGVGYTVAGDQITFAEIPLTSDIIEIRFLASGVAVTAPFDGGSVTGNVDILPSTTSTSYTSGALVVGGGVGIAGNLNINGQFGIAGTTGVPTVTSSPVNWLKIEVSGSYYYLPLYQ